MATPLEKKKQITLQIEAWFSATARDLPWRRDDFPWGRLVSEFMAQQTQISRVAERWPEMMRRFPTPASMASAYEQDVLSLWQGLGYYRRAKHLKQSAETIVNDFGGTVPSALDDLLKLPGVGRYTAGAIASMAFDKREPIVDANVHRILCRLWNHKGVPSPSSWTWKMAEELVGQCTSPKIFNEGLMEFGATVCAKKPNCKECPLNSQCDAFATDSQFEVPMLKQATTKKQVFHYAVVLECDGELAFEQRSESGLWAGMWQVPTIDSDVPLSENEVLSQLHIQGTLKQLGSFEHFLSHRSISFTVYSCNGSQERSFSWFDRSALLKLPLASAQRKVLALHCTA